MANEWTSKYIGKEEGNGSSITDWKKLRESYRPEAISLLLVGEAPPEPSSGKFFYGGSPLTECTKKAFRLAFPDLLDTANHGCFLKQFKALGCYFDDLSLEPVTKRDAFQRNYRLLQHLPKFIQRLKDSPPKVVAVVMKKIDYFVKYALDEAGLGSLEASYLQCPSRSKKSIDEYVGNLSEILIAERQKGIFPEIDFAEYGVFDAAVEKRSAERKMADRSHRVEIKLPGIPAYQFKVKDLSVKGASVLIREDSGLVPYLEVDQELDVRYYASNKRNPEISVKARIKHLTKADVAPYQGHFLVGLAISHNGRKP
jgi:PilZ domain